MQELRDNKYTIAMTESEAQKLEALAKKERRKVREYLYLLVSDLLAEK